jgi:hypothetical protein
MDRTRTAVVIGVVALTAAIAVAVVEGVSAGSNGAAAATTPVSPDSVSVSGTGSVEGVPDTLVAALRVHVQQSSVQEALNVAAADAHKVIDSLRSHGVAANDIRTTDVSLNPDYDSHGVLDGYNSGESLTVHIHPLTKVGQVLTAALGSAGNSVTTDNLSFDIGDNASLLAAARGSAFANAKAAASQYAQLGGTSLGHVMSIKAVVHNASPTFHQSYSDTLGAAAKSAALPLRPGRQKVSVTVNVVWALQ